MHRATRIALVHDLSANASLRSEFQPGGVGRGC